MQQMPPSIPALLKYLDEQFPEQCPELADAERLVWFKAGQRSVVRHLTWLRDNSEVDTNVLLTT